MTYADRIVSMPSVSPNGQRTAFPTVRITVRYPDHWEFQHALGMMASDGTGFEEHPTANTYASLAWSPVGDRLLLARQLVPGSLGGGTRFLASLDGTELGQVTPEWTGSPDWSSTRRIAFVRSTGPDCDPRCLDIWTTRLGETPRRLTYRGGHSPSWSPHGTQLAFVRSVDDHEEIYPMRGTVVASAGSPTAAGTAPPGPRTASGSPSSGMATSIWSAPPVEADGAWSTA